MPARLNHNVSLKQLHHNMRLHFGNVGTQIEKAASGMRINRSSDDPASLALANSIDAEVKALAEGGRNVQQSVHMLQVADRPVHDATDGHLVVEPVDGGLQDARQELIMDAPLGI